MRPLEHRWPASAAHRLQDIFLNPKPKRGHGDDDHRPYPRHVSPPPLLGRGSSSRAQLAPAAGGCQLNTQTIADTKWMLWVFTYKYTRKRSCACVCIKFFSSLSIPEKSSGTRVPCRGTFSSPVALASDSLSSLYFVLFSFSGCPIFLAVFEHERVKNVCLCRMDLLKDPLKNVRLLYRLCSVRESTLFFAVTNLFIFTYL